MSQNTSSSKDEQQSTSTNISEDNRIVASENATVLGKGAVQSITFDKNVADFAKQFVEAGFDFLGDVSSKSLEQAEKMTNNSVQALAEAQEKNLQTLQGESQNVLKYIIPAIVGIFAIIVFGKNLGGKNVS